MTSSNQGLTYEKDGIVEVEVLSNSDLMCGIGPKQVHQLCRDSYNGGREYTPRQVGQMTLDEIIMLLSNPDNLRSLRGGTVSTETKDLTKLVGEDGKIKGRAADGTPIRGSFSGKSLASKLAEKQQEQARQEQEAQLKKQQEAAKANRRQRRRQQNPGSQ